MATHPQTGDYRRLWPAYVLRHMVTAIITFMYLPFLEILCMPFQCECVRAEFLPDYTCWSGSDAWMPAVSAFVLLGFVPLCLATSLVHVQRNPYLADPSAGRFDFALTPARSLMVLMVLGFNNAAAEATLTLVFMAALTAQLVLTSPHYDHSMNRLRTGILAALTLLAAAAALFAWTSGAGDAAQPLMAVTYAALAPAFAAGMRVAGARLNQLCALAKRVERGVLSLSSLSADPRVRALTTSSSVVLANQRAAARSRIHRSAGPGVDSRVTGA